MDSFAEQLVKREDTSVNKIQKYLIYGGGIFLTLLLFLVAVLKLGSAISLVLMLVAVAVGYGTFYFGSATYVEYEYAFTNGELDIDKILGKRKRVSLLSVNVKNFTSFGKYSEENSDELNNDADVTTVIASDNIASHEYYADFECEKYGKTRLIFAPDEKILENINNFLPYAVKMKYKF